MNLMNQIGYLDDSMVKMSQDKYEQAKRKSVVSSKQKINGKLYPGKTQRIMSFSALAIATIMTMMAGISTLSNMDTINNYEARVNEINVPQLTNISDQINYADYEKENGKNFIEKMSEDREILNQIEEEKLELKETGEYGLDANRLRQDAINNVALENADNYLQQINDFYDQQNTQEEGGKSL